MGRRIDIHIDKTQSQKDRDMQRLLQEVEAGGDKRKDGHTDGQEQAYRVWRTDNETAT